MSAEGSSNANVIKITARGHVSASVRYAERILTGDEVDKHDSVILCGTGSAISRVISVAEIVKRRVAGLHQNVETGTLSMERRRPVEGAEDPIYRDVPNIRLYLSLEEPSDKAAGYQAPLPADMVGEDARQLVERRPPRGGGGRGGAGSSDGGGGGRGRRRRYSRRNRYGNRRNRRGNAGGSEDTGHPDTAVEGN